MADFEVVGKVGDFKPGEIRGVTVAGKDVAVVNLDGEWRAFTNLCSHQYVPLSNGYGYAKDKYVMCLLHTSVFNTETGAIMGGPAMLPLEIYDVRIEGEDVLVGKR